MKADPEGPQPTESPELFTASEFAHFCRVDLKTIHNWADKGQIRHFRTPGRHLRFRRLDVIDFLRKYGYPVPDSLRSGKPKVVVVDGDPSLLAAIRKGIGRRFEVATFQDSTRWWPRTRARRTRDRRRQSGLDGIRCLQRLKSIESTSHIRTIVCSNMKAAAGRRWMQAPSIPSQGRGHPRAALGVIGLERTGDLAKRARR
jgi:excisionase family DNA binding protein